MAVGNRSVDLVDGIWVQVTGDTTSPFLLINESKTKIQWIADTVQPPSADANAPVPNASAKRSVTLTTTESLSRFPEMEGAHLWVLGPSSTSIVIVDAFS